VAVQELALVLTGAGVMLLAAHLGPASVAAIGMIDALGYLLHALFGGLAVGATVTVAHCLGAGRTQDLRAVAASALALAAAVGLALALVLWFTRAGWIALFMPGAAAEVVAQADLYFRWLIVADLPTALVVVGCGVLRGMARTDAAMRVQVAMNLLQLLLAALFMRGVQASVGGAGFALLCARCAGAALTLWGLWSMLRQRPSGGALLQGRFVRAMLKVGWPTALENSFFHIGKLITQSLVVGLGTTAMAANFIAFSVGALLNVPGSALGVAATTLVALRLGAGQVQAARLVMRRLLHSASTVLTLLGLAVLPLSWWLAGLYGSDPEVTRLAAGLIALNCLFMPLWGGSFVLPAGLRGAGDTRYPLVVATLGMWGCRIVLGYLLGIVLGWGVLGVWLGMFGDWFVRNSLFRRRLRGARWTGLQLLS
jgi:putative MATE family efflux protein